MSLGQHDTPDTYSPVGNDLPVVLYSSLLAQVNFKYVFELWDSTGAATMYARVKKHPEPSIGFGVFLANPVLRDYLTYDFSLDNAFNENTNSFMAYLVKCYEQYGDPPAIVGSAYTSNVKYAFNGGFGHREWLDWNMNDWLVKEKLTGIPYGKLLTNAPRAQNISLSEKAWLYYMTTEISGGSEAAEYIHLSFGPNSSENFFIPNPYKDKRFVRVPAGPANLIGLTCEDSTVLTEGHFSGHTSYEVRTYNIAGLIGPTSEKFTFNIVDNCSRYGSVRLHFMNRLGGFDSFTFNKKAHTSHKLTKATYRKPHAGLYFDTGGGAGWEWGYDSAARGIQQFYSMEEPKLTLSSDFLTDAEFTWLLELVNSPVVFIEENDELIPVHIENTNYNVLKRVNDKLNPLELECSYGFVNYRQQL